MILLKEVTQTVPNFSSKDKKILTMLKPDILTMLRNTTPIYSHPFNKKISLTTHHKYNARITV